MKTILLIPTLLFTCLYTSWAQSTVYEKADSIKVVKLLTEAPVLVETADYMIYFGGKLKGTPYVAKTLEVSNEENLIVNMSGMDCTTVTETVLALSLCIKNEKYTFDDFSDFLRRIRYAEGQVTYGKRLHYFTSWIENNTENGYVCELPKDALHNTPFAGKQQLDISFMTQHTRLYPQLIRNQSLVDTIKTTEKSLSGRTVRYIPKAKLRNHALLKRYIHNGDIIAIVTNKQGLDTSHIGIASWHNDGTLHLLNASQIHKKVIDEPMTLYQYMQKHPSQIGIRVIHVL